MTKTDAKNLFLVELASKLMSRSLALPPVVMQIFEFVVQWVLGVGLSLGILKIDLTADAWTMAEKIEEYKELALKAHDKAIKRVYTEEEKVEIREEYMRLLRKISLDSRIKS